MRGAVAERRWADFDIPAPLPRVCSHIRGADAGGSAISWGQWWFGARGFEAGAVNWVLDPFLAERFLLPLRLRSATAHVWTHVMICVEANFPPAPARVRPRMCERTFRVQFLSTTISLHERIHIDINRTTDRWHCWQNTQTIYFLSSLTINLRIISKVKPKLSFHFVSKLSSLIIHPCALRGLQIVRQVPLMYTGIRLYNLRPANG